MYGVFVGLFSSDLQVLKPEIKAKPQLPKELAVETPKLQEKFPPEPPREKKAVDMDPVAHRSYAPLYYETQANLKALEEMAAEYDRAAKACSPKAMPTTAAVTTCKEPVHVKESAATPEALPSSSSGARLGEMPGFFLLPESICGQAGEQEEEVCERVWS